MEISDFLLFVVWESKQVEFKNTDMQISSRDEIKMGSQNISEIYIQSRIQDIKKNDDSKIKLYNNEQ